MVRRMMDILCCPVCGRPLTLRVDEETRGEVQEAHRPGCRDRCEYAALALSSPDRARKPFGHCRECYSLDVWEGELSCACGRRFPILKSVPRFNPVRAEQGRTQRTFDAEWTAFRYEEKIYGHSAAEELEDFFSRMGVDRDILPGKTVLDAGCGIGRLTRSIGFLAREIVGLDFSRGVEEAWLRTRAQANVHIVQGDVMSPPFREGYFDYVYSKGVLHYVPDPRFSLESLALRVRPGGTLSVTIYPEMSPLFERFNDGLRKVTVRLPVGFLYVLSHLLIPFLSLAWAWSGLRQRHIEWKERAHMILNWLSSEHQNRASKSTMKEWFRELGFVELGLSSIPVGITGRKKSVAHNPEEG